MIILIVLNQCHNSLGLRRLKLGAVLFAQVACFGRTKYTAFLKAMMSSGFKLPRPGGNIMVGVQSSFLPHFLPLAKRLHTLGYKVRIGGVGGGRGGDFFSVAVSISVSTCIYMPYLLHILKIIGSLYF